MISIPDRWRSVTALPLVLSMTSAHAQSLSATASLPRAAPVGAQAAPAANPLRAAPGSRAARPLAPEQVRALTGDGAALPPLPDLAREAKAIAALRELQRIGLTDSDIQGALAPLKQLREAEAQLKSEAWRILREERTALLVLRPGDPLPPSSSERLRQAEMAYTKQEKETWSAVGAAIGTEKARQLCRLLGSGGPFATKKLEPKAKPGPKPKLEPKVKPEPSLKPALEPTSKPALKPLLEPSNAEPVPATPGGGEIGKAPPDHKATPTPAAPGRGRKDPSAFGGFGGFNPFGGFDGFDRFGGFGNFSGFGRFPRLSYQDWSTRRGTGNLLSSPWEVRTAAPSLSLAELIELLTEKLAALKTTP